MEGTGILLAAALAFALPAVSSARADLKAALAEPDLEKRSGLAMASAADALKAARKAYDQVESGELAAALAEVRDSVELALRSLKATGKDPRGHSKWYKKAEIDSRDLLRRLDSFEQQMSYADRPMVAPVREAVQKVHDELLVSIMEGNRK